MKELVETIAKAICDHPDDVVVTETAASTSSIIDVLVHKDDLGKMIGKHGQTASAIRTIIYAASYNFKGDDGKAKRYTLDIDSH
jgi:predicted RNA-binding protein YlqC (UPF0109 family)